MQLRFTILLFSLFPFINTNAQFFSDTVYFNSAQEEVDSLTENGYYRIISNDTTGKILFNVRDFYASGKLKMTGTYRSINPDRLNGLFTYFYPDGNKLKECTYRNNILEGSYKIWYENGQLKQECSYREDKLTGVYKTWSSEGSLTKYAEYRDGKKNGEFITYYPNGNPIRKEKYRDNELLKGKCFTASGKDTAYFVYFTPPAFLGGDVSNFTKWVMEKLQYPEEAKSKHEDAYVKVKFTVDESGKVKRILFTKQDRSYFNSEVFRVISNSPVWKPARRDVKNVAVSVEVPIRFTLPDK